MQCYILNVELPLRGDGDAVWGKFAQFCSTEDPTPLVNKVTVTSKFSPFFQHTARFLIAAHTFRRCSCRWSVSPNLVPSFLFAQLVQSYRTLCEENPPSDFVHLVLTFLGALFSARTIHAPERGEG